LMKNDSLSGGNDSLLVGKRFYWPENDSIDWKKSLFAGKRLQYIILMNRLVEATSQFGLMVSENKTKTMYAARMSELK
jgi:hypothetical protein